MAVLKMADVELAGLRVFIRSDLNVPQDERGRITDDTRIKASLPAIRLALEAKSAVMVTSHLGRPTEGKPDPKHISTSFVERSNLTQRMHNRRFTRLTNAFSKKYDNHCFVIAVYFAYYNFCRVHQTIRVRRAMEAGIADHVWSIEKLVGLLGI